MGEFMDHLFKLHRPSILYFLSSSAIQEKYCVSHLLSFLGRMILRQVPISTSLTSSPNTKSSSFVCPRVLYLKIHFSLDNGES